MGGAAPPTKNEWGGGGGGQNFITKHKTSYKEIAFYGGSFTFLSESEMQAYFDEYKDHLDDKTFFRISTRPDGINTRILQFLKENKVNTIELGIQSFSDRELKACQRGYDAKTAIEACNLIKSFGFNLSVQLLIGLPGADKESYKESMEQLREIKPEIVRLYPLLVLKGTELETMYQSRLYQPLSVEEAAIICVDFLRVCRENDIIIAKIGLHGDIKQDSVVAGPYYPNFGEIVYGLDFAMTIIEKNEQLDPLMVSEKEFSWLNAYDKFGLKILKEKYGDLKIYSPQNSC